ncbi:MAG: ABC transporter ATP-binding protein [Hyphomicrobiales bacterium]|nr:ABC transporter ATP-binding protein [Hyphomicrobiales bacterium]
MTGPVPVLAIEGLSLHMAGLPLVADLSLTIAPGEMVGLVGESGCGKSVTALSIMRLLPEPPIRIAGGHIRFNGQDLASLSQSEMRRLRGREIGMIFQEPMSSLNPVFTVGDQIAEPLLIHRGLGRAAARRRAVELLELVGIPHPDRTVDRFPHQLSGGQRQRAMIASAIACEPKLLIADEPTTALDVTVQAQVLDLINRLRREMGMACLLITHDLGVVAEVCERAHVMYAGRIVEHGAVKALFASPRHRYTRALLDTIPARNQPGRRLPSIPGMVPPPGARGDGCSFAERCPAAIARCLTERPLLAVAGQDPAAACWNPAP